MATVRITLATPHWDAAGRLYRPGERDVPVEVAEAWGYVPSEPEQVVDSDIPEDFPGRDALIAAGHLTLESVAAIDFAETKVKGVGTATAEKIAEALAAE